MKCFSDDYDKVTVGWTVKAKEKPSTVDWADPLLFGCPVRQDQWHLVMAGQSPSLNMASLT